MTRELSGRTIGNYEIGELLGAGGMGQVYRGTHTMLNRQAAVKVMHPHLSADPAFRTRFLQEAKAAAELDHPNIVQIYEFDERDGQFFLVMELITGGSLRGLMSHQRDEESRWPLRDGLELIRQAAEGLGYAHSKSMVHRDIKPDNLLLKPIDHSQSREGSYVVKISDFGLARIAESAVRTASGVTMGTPAYLSPEQAQGAELDGRSDLYSLGVVLYELATGYLPFETRTLSDAVYKHVYVAPTSPRELNENLPEELESVILQCLEKKPGDRFSNATELIDAIQRVEQTLDPVTSIPDSHLGSPDEQTTQNQPAALDPPDVVPDVPETSATPRIQILGPEKAAIQIIHLPDEGIAIGRLQDNDVTLPDEAVSRRHLRVDFDGDRVQVSDLGSWNGSTLGDERLLPNVAQTWNPGDWLRIGTYWLRLIPPNPVVASGPAHVVDDLPARRDTRPSSGGRIRILLDDDRLSITPGSPASLDGTVVNLGNTVDHLRVVVEGVPEEWVASVQGDIQLNPGDQSAFTLQINVPRTFRSRAGQYPVSVHAISQAGGGETNTATATWEVTPFDEFNVGLSPTRASGRTEARFDVELENRGNHPEVLTLSAQDEERVLRFRFNEEQARLSPGDSGSIALLVAAPRRWFGKARPYSFSVRTKSESGYERSVTGQMLQRSTIPAMVFAIVGAAILGTIWLLSILPSNGTEVPSIDRFTIDPEQVTAGESVTVSWLVSDADEITLELPGGRIARDLPDSGSIEDTLQEGGSYVLVGANSAGAEVVDSRSVEVTTPGEETPPVDPDQSFEVAVNGLDRGSDSFQLSLRNPDNSATVHVSVFSLSVTDDKGNQYEFDRFAMNQGLQVTVPANGSVNIDYVLQAPIADEADVVTFVLSDLFEQQNDGPFRTPLAPVQLEVALP